MSEIETRILKLREFKDAYYNGTPLISDAEYDELEDSLIDQLKKENPSHPFLAEVGAEAPTDSVWPKFKHPEIMGSLAKASPEKLKEEFAAWKTRDGGKGDIFHLSEKIDGCTVVAVYQKGKLTTLATRGDGTVGDDITGNAKDFPHLLKTLPEPINITLRGEAAITVADFALHGTGFANPRNAASGKLRDTNKDNLKGAVRFYWFEVIGGEFETWDNQFTYLQKLGLTTPPSLLTKEATIWKAYEAYVEKRPDLDYWIDGLVIRVNNLEKYRELGASGNRPKGAIALKFPPRGVETVIRSVEINRGLQGRYTPVAIVDPVQIDGTTISRVTLNNYDWIRDAALAIGDRVEVVKGGDIIPKIVKKISDGTDRKPITPPESCDACDAKLERVGAYLECTNDECSGRDYGALLKWINVLDIRGIGPAHLQSLIIAGIMNPADLHKATEDQLIKALNSDAIGSKVYRMIVSKKGQIPLNVLLSGLNIPALGKTNGARLAETFESLDDILGATLSDFSSIEGIGPTNSLKIWEGLKEKKELIIDLAKILGTGTARPVAAKLGGKLAGKSFCLTGALPSGQTRKEATTKIEAAGGSVKADVAKGLDYLVTDEPDSGSSKNKKADKLGVKKISETDLEAMLA